MSYIESVDDIWSVVVLSSEEDTKGKFVDTENVRNFGEADEEKSTKF